MKTLKGPADGAVGVVTFLVAVAAGVACSMAAVIIEAFSSMMGSVAHQTTFAQGPNGAFVADPSAERSETIRQTVIIVLLVLLGILFIACAIGIFLGKPWGFRIGVVLYALLMAGGSGASVLGLAGAVYCVLRLQGLLGARPPATP